MSLRRTVRLAAAVWMMLGCSVFGMPQLRAWADPGDPGVLAPDPAPAPAVPLSRLGRTDRLDILSSDQPVDTDIPVPQGVTPGLLTGVVGSVTNVVGGRVEVLDGSGSVLGTIPAAGDQAVPFAVDISRARVAAGSATLSFILRVDNPPADSCSRPPSLVLRELAASYLGESPYPATVADFRPGYVEQVLIRTGPTPTADQQQAALQLVADLTRHYRPIPVRIEVDISAGPAPGGPPTRRVIEIRESDTEPEMTVLNPGLPDAVLVISGRGSELGRQVRLFADRNIELAQGPTASVQTAAQMVPAGSTLMTFAQLGMGGEISVLGSATLYVGFDAGQFAVGPVQQAALRLVAHYTPVTGGEASVVVRSGSVTLGSRRLDESGLFEMTATIPPEAIQSTVGIALQVRYLPAQRCAPLNDRIQFSLDPASTVTVVPGTHNRGGFPVLPMAFTPEFDVALDQPDRLRLAAAAINLLGQQSAEALQPRLVSLTQAAESGVGALVVAAGAELRRVGFDPPMLAGPAGSVTVGGPEAAEFDLNGPVGVVQAFSDRGRTVLALTAAEDWSLVDRCLDYIWAQPSRWGSLTGDVIATGPAGRSVALTVREGGALADDYPGDGWKWWTWVTGGAVAAALLVTTSILLRRRVNGRR